jgi:8-amino-7-oxononanoate synthase
MKNEEWIEKELAEISSQNLERRLYTYKHKTGMVFDGYRTYVNFSSNNYLNFAKNSQIINFTQDYLVESGIGSTASRLVSGTKKCHTELEERLAEFKEYPATLVFGSGFLTNAGVITTLIGKNDHVYSDRLIHASIIDAIILSKASVHRFNHNDPEHLKTLLEKYGSSGKRLIVTESVFSMDGDIAPLAEIAEIAEKYNAMFMVDEAHSTGIFGPDGRGLVNELKLEHLVNAEVGTFSKALGGYGGFVACSKNLKKLLVNKARSFIYTTALPPVVIGSALGAIKMLLSNPRLGTKLLDNAAMFRGKLQDAGLDTANSQSQIIPIIIGDTVKTLSFSNSLKEKGILAIAIRPPSVPKDTSRLRLSVTLGHSRELLEETAGIIIDCARQEGVI